jgi:hypothetical protein
MRLRDFWENLVAQSPEFAGNRSFEAMFKVAKAFARLTLKTAVDSEIIELTIHFMQQVFQKHGTEVTKPVRKEPHHGGFSHLMY